ncbi:MAG: hypothetical protein WDW21_00850 [Neisseriaceae bacterium]
MGDNTVLIVLMALVILFYFLLIRLDSQSRYSVSKKEIAAHKKMIKEKILQEERKGKSEKKLTEVELPAENTVSSVSTRAIDELSEYRVFKELGYLHHASKVLSELIENNKNYQQPEHILELGNLYAEIGTIDQLAELLETYSYLLEDKEIRELVSTGFHVESSNYRLQLFCTKVLKEDPKIFDLS